MHRTHSIYVDVAYTWIVSYLKHQIFIRRIRVYINPEQEIKQYEAVVKNGLSEERKWDSNDFCVHGELEEKRS